MKIYAEKALRDFKFWAGAKENASKLTDEQLDAVESILEDLYPEGMEETAINDIFWFEFDQIQEWLGMETEEDE